MGVTRLLPVLILLSLSACSSPTDRDPESDPRLGSFSLDSVDGGRKELWGWVLWKNQDGWRFELVGNSPNIRCLDHGGAEEGYDLVMTHESRPDSAAFSTAVLDEDMECELVGSESMVLRNRETGVTRTGTVYRSTDGCIVLRIPLPGKDWFRSMIREGHPEIPTEVVLPDPMPLGIYEMWGCDGGDW
jgi:hypothetical protein